MMNVWLALKNKYFDSLKGHQIHGVWYTESGHQIGWTKANWISEGKYLGGQGGGEKKEKKTQHRNFLKNKITEI